MWYWILKYIFLGPLLSLLGRPKVEGLEHVPSSGPVILASNHLAVMDSFYLPLVVLGARGMYEAILPRLRSLRSIFLIAG